MEVVDSQNLIDPSLSTLNDEPQKIEKLKPLELLKMKMCKSHDLIMNYNDKLKECINLKTSLEQAQHKAKNMETKYMTTLQKLINVELQNTNLRKSLEDSKNKIVNLETKTAGDQRLIQQLNCKIEDNDEKNADKLMDADLNKLKLEEKIKSLEQEIKTLKKPRPDKKTSRKHKGVNTEQVQIVDFDSSLNAEANLLENRLRGSEFNESVDVKEENSSSILCVKCDAAFDKLIHSFEQPEPLVTPISSPNPQFYPNEIQSLIEPIYSPMRGREEVEPEYLTDPPKEINLESETIKALEKRLKNLERKIKKKNKVEDKNRCCHSSSNSYFPNPANQDIMLELWKKLLDKDKPAHKRKCKKKLKRCKNKRKVISKKKDKRKSLQNWSVESSIESDNLIQENSEIIVSRKKNSELQIGDNSLEESREFPGPSKKKELISFPVSNESEHSTLFLGNKYEKRTARKENEDFKKYVSRKPYSLPQVILEQESVFILETSKDEKQANITEENNFEMLEVSHGKILTSSPNIEPPKVQETDIISKEAPTLRKEISTPKESILNQEKQINARKENNFEMLKVNRDKIYKSSPNIEPPKIQQTDIVSKEASIFQKVIPDSVQSILNQEKQINVTKENKFEMMQVNRDQISTSTSNVETAIHVKDAFSREPSNLRKEVPGEVESILNQERQTSAANQSDFEMLEVNHDSISARSANIVTAIQEKVLLPKESPTLPKIIPESLSHQEKQINSTNDFETLEVSRDKISASSPNIERLIQEKVSPTSLKIPEEEESVLILEKSKQNLSNSISASSPNVIKTPKILGSQKDSENDLNKPSTSEESRKVLENRIQSVKEEKSSLLNQEKETNSTNYFETPEVSYDKISASSPNIERLIQEKVSPTSLKIPEAEESVLILEKSKQNLPNSISASSPNIVKTPKILGNQKDQESVLNKPSTSEESSIVLENRIQSVKEEKSSLLNQEIETNYCETPEMSYDKISVSSPNIERLIQEKVSPTSLKISEVEESVLILEKSKQNLRNSISASFPNIVETPKIVGNQKDQESVLNKPSTSEESSIVLENRIQSVKEEKSSLLNQEKETNDFETLEVSRDKISASSPNIERLIQEKVSPTSLKFPEAEESVLILEKSKQNLPNSISASSPNVIKTPKILGSQKDSENDLNKPSTSEESRKVLENRIQSVKEEKSSLLNQEKETNSTNYFETPEVSYDKISASSPNIERLVQEKVSPTSLKIPEAEESVLILEKSKQNLPNSISASSPNIIETPKILGNQKDEENVLNKPSTSEESRKILESRIQSVKGKKSSLLNQEKETNSTNYFKMPKVSHDKISASSPNIETLIEDKESLTPLKIPEPEESVFILEKSKQNLPNSISASSPNIIETPKILGNQKDEENVLNKPSTSEESRKILESRIQSVKGKKSSLLNQEKETNSTNYFKMPKVSHDKISASSPNIETLIEDKESLTPLKIPEPEESVFILEKSKQNLPNSISPSSPNIIETPKILGNQKDQENVLSKPSTSEESRKILERRIQSVKRKKSSSPEESLDHVNNLPVLGEHSRKMVRRRLSSHYSSDSLDVEPRINSCDFQSMHSEKTCTNLVMNPEKEEGNEMPEEISEMDESSITDQVQMLDTVPSFEIKEELESTEKISQELANSFDEKRTSDLLDELALSDDEPPEEIKMKSNSSLEDTSHIFISNSNRNDSKNFIQGKRSSALLLTVISPVSQAKKMKKVDVKNSKPGNRGNLLTKIRTLKRRTNKMVLHPIVKKPEEKKEVKIEPKTEVENDVESVASNSLVQPKKRRIAHTPKAESESGSVTSFDDFPLEVPIRKSLRSASKSPGKNKRIKSSEEKSANVEEKEEKFPVRKKGRPKKVKLPEVNSVNLSIKAERREDLRIDVEPLNLCSDKSQSEDLIKSSVQENSNSTNSTSSDEDVALASRIVVKNEYWEKAKRVLESIKETEKDSEASVRELRSRQVEVAAEENLEKPGIWKKGGKPKFLPVDPRNPLLKSHYVIKLLNETFEEKPFVDLRQKSKLSQGSLEKNVKLQLSRLVVSESWTMELHLDVIKNMTELCQASTAAKCIVSFLQKTFQEDEEPLDKSNTPPAPMMSRTQQKIVTLIASLEKRMSNIVDLVSAGIDYSLFRLNEEHKNRNVIEGLARVYIVLARLKKDREKARLFCCDALYCLRNNAVTVIYVVLTCWPEVFPICDTNPEILPKCMAHIILTTDGCGTKYPKVGALKNLISAYYQYPRAEYFSKQLAVEFLSALKQKHENSTDMAIILLAKKEGPDWTYKNIIQGGLLQMIVEKTHPSVYDAFSLLGNLMRTFPKEDKENYIGKTVQQLCDLLDSSQGTEDHLEGVATALLSLSKFTNHLDKVAKCLLLWKPNQTLRPETIVKFKFFFQSRTTVTWRDFIVNDYKNLTEPRPNNNVHNKKPQLSNSQVQTKKKQNNRRRTKKANTSAKVPSNS